MTYGLWQWQNVQSKKKRDILQVKRMGGSFLEKGGASVFNIVTKIIYNL